MDNGIGATLREARNRRKLTLSEAEAAIKIRVRYLQAMENEEWDALPGGAYTRGFIRTYGSYLGLDGERLAEDYRRAAEPPGGERAPKRVEPVPTAVREGESRTIARVGVAAVLLVVAGLALAMALAGGDDGAPAPKPDGGENAPTAQRPEATTTVTQPGVAVRLEATDEVWVCLLDAMEEPLVDGQILAPGEGAGPYRSTSFEAAFGNGSVRLLIDGEPADVPASNSPVGYAIDSDGAVSPLEEGERPDCE